MKKNKDKNSTLSSNETKKKKKSLLTEEDLQGIDIVQRNREELKDERDKRINSKFERNASGQMIEAPQVRYKISGKVLAIIVIAIMVIAWLLYNVGPIFGIHIKPVSSNIEENKIEFVTKESDIYGEYNNELFVFSKNTITTYNDRCEVTWTHSFSDSFTPKIYVKGKYMLVTNNSTGTLYLFENSKEILNKKIDGTIKNVFLDKYGNMAIEYSANSGYNNMVSVYNKKGENRYDTFLSQEGIIALEMLDNAEKVVFCEAVTNSSTVGVKFRVIDITKSEDEMLKDIVTLDNSFVYNFFVDKKDIYALLNDKIVKININSGDIETIKEFNDTTLMYVSINKNYFTTLDRNIENNNYVLDNVGYSQDKVSQTTLELAPKSMIISGLVNYFIYQDHIQIYNKWGVDLGSREISFIPKKSIAFNHGKSLALIYTNKIYIVNL